MKKRLFAMLLALILVMPTSVVSFAENPLTIESPQSLNTYHDQEIKLRWTLPQSIVNSLENEEWEGDLFYCIDWKVNNGPWHFDDPKVNSGTYDLDEDVSFVGYVVNVSADENNVQEVFFTHWSFGLNSNEEIDLVNNKYTFRMRFAFNAYDNESSDYITSSYSNEVSIGGNANAKPPKTIEAPTNLKVELKRDANNKPYFALNWSNPTSVNTINENYPIGIKVDFKVGTGRWYSEVEGLDWWGTIPYSTKENFDPIEKDILDKIEIEENEYSFRILYIYEPVDGSRVVSPYSNIVKIGTPAYVSASPYHTAELDQAFELGFFTDGLDGKKMNGPITREEFAEVAVNFYEIVTGKNAVPIAQNPFTDCINPEVLKAVELKITNGVGDGTKFAPNDLLPREQMATMITRTLTACFEEVTKAFIANDVKGVADFKDQKDVSSWAADSGKFMAKYNITLGDGKGNFLPKVNCTREQALAFLLRSYLNKDLYLKK